MKTKSPSPREQGSFGERPFEKLCDVLQIESTKYMDLEEITIRRDFVQESEDRKEAAQYLEEWVDEIDFRILVNQYRDLFNKRDENFLQGYIEAYNVTRDNITQKAEIIDELVTIGYDIGNRPIELFSDRKEILDLLEDVFTDDRVVFEDDSIVPLTHSTKSRLEQKVDENLQYEIDSNRAIVKIDASRIGWLKADGKIDVDVELCEHGGHAFWFGNIISNETNTKEINERTEEETIIKSNAAISALQKLEQQSDKNSGKNMAEILMEDLRTNIGAKFVIDLLKGSSDLRPIHKTRSKSNREKTVDTTISAYKLDVRGTDNRAIILMPGKVDGKFVILVAALFDHDDDKIIYRSFN